MGATPFYPCAEADDSEGRDTVVRPWLAGLWGPLKTAWARTQAPGALPQAAAPLPAAKVQEPTSTLGVEPSDALLASVTHAGEGLAQGGERSAAALVAMELCSEASAASVDEPGAPAVAGGLVKGLAPLDANLSGAPDLMPCRWGGRS